MKHLTWMLAVLVTFSATAYADDVPDGGKATPKVEFNTDASLAKDKYQEIFYFAHATPAASELQAEGCGGVPQEVPSLTPDKAGYTVHAGQADLYALA